MTRKDQIEAKRQRLDAIRMETGLWNVDEAAAALGRSRRFIYELVERGAIPHSRVSGGTVVFKRQRILAWIDELEQGPGQAKD
jgi:excisionase family DNA binding protein